jgi:hypothetical protein
VLSSNDQIQWETFEKNIIQTRAKYNKAKTQSSKHLLNKDRSHDDNTGDEQIERQSPSSVNENHDKFENIDHIRAACQQIKWNVVNNNSNVLILTVQVDSDKSICSLSNMEPRVDYPHLCQYG